MNVLILGNEQSHGYGLGVGKLSYVSHLIRQVSRTGQSIQVDVHTPPTACCLVNTLSQLSLHPYDLILIQTERVADELTRSRAWPGREPALLTELLTPLRPFRHTVVLLTPLPHQNRAVRHRRDRFRRLLMRKADRQLFSLFDTSAWLLPRPEYFLDDSSSVLNAVSHELLGRSLYTFYQSAPTIVTVQPTRRG